MLIFFLFLIICLYASSNSSFSSALKTSQVFHILMNAHLTHEKIHHTDTLRTEPCQYVKCLSGIGLASGDVEEFSYN